MSSDLDEIRALLGGMSAEERQIIEAAALQQTEGRVWIPTPGPQAAAYNCEADELFYGGQAGGGKTDLGLGLALTAHKRSLILRRVNKDALKLVDRLEAILGHRDGYNGQLQKWRTADWQIDIAGCEHDDDKQRFKGDPHDLIYFDEGTDFLFSQYRFIIGWNRSAIEGQRCRVVVGSNPPTTSEGWWVVKHWGPWLDPTHPNPAVHGELRWFTTGPDGEDIEVDGRGPHLVAGEMVGARSRTYIPAKLSDNPDLAGSGYSSVLAGLPPELRKAYRDGDFTAALRDDDQQVIPTAWIEAAQKRWTPNPPRQGMTALAADVAQGGDDFTVIASRYGGWYAPLERRSGKDTKSGLEVAQLVIAVRKNQCPVIVDAGGGWGADAAHVLGTQGIPVVSYMGLKPSNATGRDGSTKFFNKRAEAWWRMREELNPEQEFGSSIALPPSPQIKADLAAPRWEMTTRGVKIEEKREIKKRLGRSPDDGDAIVMCLSEGSKAAAALAREGRRQGRQGVASVGYGNVKKKLWGNS